MVININRAKLRPHVTLVLLTLYALCLLFVTIPFQVEAVNSPTLSDTDANIRIGTPNPGNINNNDQMKTHGIGSPNPGNPSENRQQNEYAKGNTRQRESSSTSHKNRATRDIAHDYQSYMHWCEAVLGIQSVVEIKEFEYIDHLRIHWDHSSDISELDSEKDFDWLQPLLQKSNSKPAEKPKHQPDPTIIVRGLAAKHDIQVGDIVISIPLYSLLSVPTTIDHDPVLSRILGPEARQKYGWDNVLEYEVPLLVIAILYHKSLGQDSPLWRYIELLSGSSISLEYFPFLWSEKELKSRTGEIGVDVRDLARGIRTDVYQMYDSVMGTLVEAHAEMFGPPEGYTGDDNDGKIEWYFSYKYFQWAFAMVISRHHFLPIAEFDEVGDTRNNFDTLKDSVGKPDEVMHETLTSVSDLPPANQPTDSWVEEAINEERVSDDTNESTFDDDASVLGQIKHSFMAPLADLINFGPPCLTGSYNTAEHAFELIATCPFKTGQEVTFWYSSDCADIIVANYGFLHPLVPTCTSSDEWKDRAQALEEKDRIKEEEIRDLYKNVDLLREELSDMNSQLVECGCDNGEKKNSDQHKLRKDGHPRHEIGVRGHSHNVDDHDAEDL